MAALFISRTLKRNLQINIIEIANCAYSMCCVAVNKCTRRQSFFLDDNEFKQNLHKRALTNAIRMRFKNSILSRWTRENKSLIKFIFNRTKREIHHLSTQHLGILLIFLYSLNVHSLLWFGVDMPQIPFSVPFIHLPKANSHKFYEKSEKTKASTASEFWWALFLSEECLE